MSGTSKKPTNLSDESLDQAAGGTSRDSADLDSLSEMGESSQFSLQAKMDAATKSAQTLSNLLKKSSDTTSGIIGNMK